MQTSFSAESLADPAMAASEAVIRKCVHCGFCMATCPTYLLLGDELDGPRGRIYLMKEMLENERQPTAEVVKHIDRCLSCLSCVTTCPSGVNYAHLVDHARAYIEARYERPLLDRAIRALLGWVLPHPGRFRLALKLARLARPLGPALKTTPALKPVAAMLELANGAQQFVIPESRASGLSGTLPHRTVALLQGCAEPVLRPEIRAATVRLLNRAGYDVVFAEGEACCGALVHHLGQEAAGLAAARRNIDAWMRLAEATPLCAILVTASGCGTMIKDYGFMLRDDPAFADKAAHVSSLAKDVSEFLATIEMPPGNGHGLAVAYQAPCSLQHGQKVATAPQRLLRDAGFEVRTPRDAHLCCGSAGVYNILQPDIAGQLGEQKASHLAALNAPVIATGNIGCATQIARHGAIPVVHIVELLDWASGGPKPAGMGRRDGARSL